MRFTVLVALALASALLPVSAIAQVADTLRGTVLTLDEAIALAQRNNPLHLQFVNDRRAASASVRAAYGALLPSANLSFSSEYRKEGSQPFQGLNFSTSSDVYQSSYWLGLQYDISPSTFITPRLESARRDAVEAEIVGFPARGAHVAADRHVEVLAGAPTGAPTLPAGERKESMSEAPFEQLNRYVRGVIYPTRREVVIEAAQRHLDEHPHHSEDGAPLQCPAMTRHGDPCQRAPLPESGFCPSHRHLAAAGDHW